MPNTPNDLPRQIKELIHELSAADASVRETAAAKIFARGCDLARPLLEQWLADEELAQCFVSPSGRAPAPEQTVGLAVQPETFERIRRAFGSPALADVPPDQDALEFEIENPSGVRLDILTSCEPLGSGAIARFLQKFGEGIQQIELLVAEADAASRLLRERFGILPLFPATRAGANGTRVNFFLVTLPAGGKVLIELVEAKAHPRGLC